ncbi:hypothetical protein K2X33_03005 [bacterium]|nr:hypothetical protein [bacterium]
MRACVIAKFSLFSALILSSSASAIRDRDLYPSHDIATLSSELMHLLAIQEKLPGGTFGAVVYTILKLGVRDPQGIVNRIRDFSEADLQPIRTSSHPQAHYVAGSFVTLSVLLKNKPETAQAMVAVLEAHSSEISTSLGQYLQFPPASVLPSKACWVGLVSLGVTGVFMPPALIPAALFGGFGLISRGYEKAAREALSACELVRNLPQE